MHFKCMSHHIRRNHRTSRPRFNGLFCSFFILSTDTFFVDDDQQKDLFSTTLPYLLLPSTFNDKLIGFLIRSCDKSFCIEPPRSLRSITFMLTFTTTVWVVNRVHRCTTDSRTDSLPAHTSCFSFDYANYAQD